MEPSFQERLAAFRSLASDNGLKVSVSPISPLTVQPDPSGVQAPIAKEVIQAIRASGNNGRFVRLDDTVDDLFAIIRAANNIVLVKPVQAGKTAEVIRIIEHTYQYSVTIFLSDKNTALAGQTNKRTTGMGWKVADFRDCNSPKEAMKYLRGSIGQRKMAHFLMEVNNIETLIMVCESLSEPITLIVDEGDKNKNVVFANNDQNEAVDDDSMPPITKGIIACKNILKERADGSKTIFVTATPQGLLVSEKDEDRLVIVKEPYKNWVGVAYNHPANFNIVQAIRFCSCKARDRWTNNGEDVNYNTYAMGVIEGLDRFEKMDTKDDSIKQIMLISLENRNAAQARLAHFVRRNLLNSNAVDLIVFNGENKDKATPLLADKIAASDRKKIIVISGFMAARGVSFTDFSDTNNRFELVLQVHAAKKTDPLNSALQAMRIFGPARKTVARPTLVCNKTTADDCAINFLEGYRICQEIAEGKKTIAQGKYNSARPLTQAYNFRYFRQGRGWDSLLFESRDPADHEPILDM